MLIKITEIYNLGLSDTNFINDIDTKNTRVILKKNYRYTWHSSTLIVFDITLYIQT